MTFLQDFDNSKMAINTNIQQLDNLISEKSDVQDDWERIKAVNKYVEKKLSSAIPQLTPLGVLSNLKSHYDQLLGHFKRTDVANINATLDSILSSVNNLTTQNMADFVETLKESLPSLISNFKRNQNLLTHALEKKQEELSTTEKSLDDKLKSLAQRIGQTETQITTLTANFQGQFSQAQQQQRAEHNTNLSSLKQEQADLIKKYRTEYDNLVQKNEADRQEHKKTVENLIVKLQTTHEDVLKQTKENSAAILKLMEEKRRESEEILGVVTGNAHAGHYTKYANAAEAKSKNLFIWGIVAVVIAAIVIVAPIMWDFFNSKKENIDYTYFIYRVLSSAILLLPAAYLLYESAKQRDVAFKYRDFEVRICASEPYLSKLSSAERDKIKGELAKAFFVTQHESKEKDNNIVIPKEASNFILDFAGKLFKIK
ncbi:MAG: hypothetical protein PHP45_02300 [Elusimicrobiales bacterium]|nr:hypothetical protein [Elusimicrobiales bacterium]